MAREIQKIERKLFCFARRSSAGGNAWSGLKVKIGIFVKKSSDFNQKAPYLKAVHCSHSSFCRIG